MASLPTRHAVDDDEASRRMPPTGAKAEPVRSGREIPRELSQIRLVLADVARAERDIPDSATVGGVNRSMDLRRSVERESDGGSVVEHS